MNIRRNVSRRGLSLLWALAAMTALMALASLAVDFGRVQVAKTELRRAADAAARAGAAVLGSPSGAADAAYQLALANTCLGTPVEIDKPTDVELGKWDSTQRTFTPLAGGALSTADAIRVTCRRIQSRQNAIPLMFGGLIGMRSCNVTASTIATFKPVGYGLVGLSFIKLSGNASLSYWSSSGQVGGENGNVASNGNITSTGSSTVHGTAWVKQGSSVTGVAANAVKTFPQTLTYPAGNSSPYSLTNNNNKLIPQTYISSGPSFTLRAGQKVSIPGGYYLFNNFTTSGSSSLTFTGPTTIYYFGTFTMSGTTNTNLSLPKNLTIVAIPNPTTGSAPGALTLSGTSSLYANVYAPQSSITLSGTGSIYGSVIGGSITASGTASIYYDQNLQQPGASAISIVK